MNIWIYKEGDLYCKEEYCTDSEENARMYIALTHPDAEFFGPLPEGEESFESWVREMYRAEAVKDFIEALETHTFECNKGDPRSLMEEWVRTLSETAEPFGVRIEDSYVDLLDEDGDEYDDMYPVS